MSEPQTTLPPAPVFSPKDNFLKLESTSQAWRNVVRNDHTATALTYALSEYATSNPTAEQISGVQSFIKVLLGLAEPKSPARGAFPDKRLVPPSETLKGEDKK